MSIVYSLVCKDNDKVLCEYTEFQGNFEQISRNLLKKVQREARATFSYNNEYIYYIISRFYFHYVNSNNLTYMCMCDNKIAQDTAFTYLEELKILFLDTFSKKEIEEAYSYGLNDRFKDGFKSKMVYLYI